MVLNGLPYPILILWLIAVTHTSVCFLTPGVWANPVWGSFVTMIRWPFWILCWPTFGGHSSCLIRNLMFTHRIYCNFLHQILLFSVRYAREHVIHYCSMALTLQKNHILMICCIEKINTHLVSYILFFNNRNYPHIVALFLCLSICLIEHQLHVFTVK